MVWPFSHSSPRGCGESAIPAKWNMHGLVRRLAGHLHYYGLVPRLFLIDSFGFIFRAYHARARSGAPPMRTAAGISTEAVYIFHNMVRKLKSQHSPDYLAAIFESEGPTFRDA